MNMKRNPTKEQLRLLLRRCDDQSADHVIWISSDGGVHISPLSQEYTLSEWDRAMARAYSVRMDSVFAQGGEYVGPSAADDPDWVSELYAWLLEAWTNAQAEDAPRAHPLTTATRKAAPSGRLSPSGGSNEAKPI